MRKYIINFAKIIFGLFHILLENWLEIYVQLQL